MISPAGWEECSRAREENGLTHREKSYDLRTFKIEKLLSRLKNSVWEMESVGGKAGTCSVLSVCHVALIAIK